MNNEDKASLKRGRIESGETIFEFIDFGDGQNKSVLNLKLSNDAPIFLFAHGSGAGMESDFIQSLAIKLGTRGVRVIVFNFAYMVQVEQTGKRRPPPKIPLLEKEFVQVIKSLNAALNAEIKHFGGKSMGGRLASLLVAGSNDKSEEAKANQNVNERDGIDFIKTVGQMTQSVHCFGFPFYPKGKSDPELGKWRLNHFNAIEVPCFIYQGTRDDLGNKENVLPQWNSEGLNHKTNLVIDWFNDGDHDIKPRKSSGHSQSEYLDSISNMVADRIFELENSRS